MIGIKGNIVPTILLAALYCFQAQAQVAPPTVLEIDLENIVRYVADISDPSRFATNPGVTPAADGTGVAR